MKAAVIKLWIVLCVTPLGCDGDKTPKSPQLKRQQAASQTEIIAPLSRTPSLDKYRPTQPKSFRPALAKTKANPKVAKANDGTDPLSLTVTIEAASMASGETADQFPGLIPNERFFIASYLVVNDSTGRHERHQEYKLRLKTDDPKSLIGRLGQPVKIMGRWVHMGHLNTRSQPDQKLPEALNLRPLKGQDLVAAAERQRAEFIRETVGSEAGSETPKKAGLFLDRSALPNQAQTLPPLFHVSKVVPLKGTRFNPKSLGPAPR
tara:strand:+ start:847 stop:1635 length:789 start_codon:yes stop_codon:yes gene_type:complete